MTLIKKADVQKHYAARRLTLVPARTVAQPDATGISKDGAAVSSVPGPQADSIGERSLSSPSLASSLLKKVAGSTQS